MCSGQKPLRNEYFFSVIGGFWCCLLGQEGKIRVDLPILTLELGKGSKCKLRSLPIVWVHSNSVRFRGYCFLQPNDHCHFPEEEGLKYNSLSPDLEIWLSVLGGWSPKSISQNFAKGHGVYNYRPWWSVEGSSCHFSLSTTLFRLCGSKTKY